MHTRIPIPVRTGWLIVSVSASVLTISSQAQDVPKFARDLPSIRSGEPIFQFNGKDLTGFYTYLHDYKYDDPAKVFTVHDGMIQISGDGFGGLSTKDEFRDYHLVTEWKW